MPVMSLSAQQFALSQMAAGPPRHNDQPQKETTVLRAHKASWGTDEYTIRNLFVTTFAKAPAVVVEGSKEDEELVHPLPVRRFYSPESEPSTKQATRTRVS